MIRITEKQVIALRCGLDHGALAKALDFKNYHNGFLLKRERDAYRSGYNLAVNDDYVTVYKREGSAYRLLIYAITCGDIVPVKWEVYRDPFYNTFSIETVDK